MAPVGHSGSVGTRSSCWTVDNLSAMVLPDCLDTTVPWFEILNSGTKNKEGVIELFPDIQAGLFSLRKIMSLTFVRLHDHYFLESYSPPLKLINSLLPSLGRKPNSTLLSSSVTEFCFSHTRFLLVPALGPPFSEPLQKLFLLLGTFFIPCPG